MIFGVQKHEPQYMVIFLYALMMQILLCDSYAAMFM